MTAPSPALVYKLALLRQLALAALPYSPASALFYAERLYVLDPAHESSAHLLAAVQSAANKHNDALWTLRQPVTFTPDSASSAADDPFLGNSRRWPQASTSAGRLTRPAAEASVRCARLYGQACLVLKRDKEGREALGRVIQPGTPLAPPAAYEAEAASLWADTASPLLQTADEGTVVELELARLAMKGGDYERAILSFRRVVAKVPTCWEAIEALCALGAPPDVDALFPVQARPSAAAASAAGAGAQNVPPAGAQAAPAHAPGPRPLAPTNSNSAPLAPSQTAAVNMAFAGYGAAGRAARNGMDSGGLFTPTEVAVKPGGLFGQNGKGKGREVVGGLFGAGGAPPPLRRTGSGRYDLTADISTADESSFDASFYPSNGPLSFAPTSTTTISGPSARNGNGAAASSGSLFTPPTGALPTATAPGVKRTRAGNIAPASTATAASQQQPQQYSVADTLAGRRIRPPKGRPPAAPPTRRSSRLSSNAVNGSSAGDATSAAMAVSRSQTSTSSRTGGVNGGSAGATNGGSRDKKRTKGGAGPSVLSDAGSEALSYSSSPAPSSPGTATQQQQQQSIGMALDALDPAARLDAHDHVVAVVRCFALAATRSARFEMKGAVEALGALPAEQARSARGLVMLAKAHYEMLNYAQAEKAFQQARQVAPYLVDGMELYSTALWHLRSSTALSFLAQELVALDAHHPSSWIASGNVFSHLEDHASALRCFRRAAQLDEGCVYAYTLGGHECIMLEEWERALDFFREAVRRDPLHYNAWFGLGNVYLKTGKHTLAEYHFRRALEINPANTTLLCCVGTVLEKLRRTRDALDMYERAAVVAPESPLVRFKRTAERDLVSLDSQAPTEPNVQYLLGKLYKHLGRRQDMLRHFARAQDLEPRMASIIREQIESAHADAHGGMDVDDSGLLA
ncbi:hypothetical protein Rhopal_001762-T1 [Rhodotorula paludigena]|uniref:Uncharacterized protein n=1 Tax=Rhodotorula paludigena TaxID=86838 RepID=A0AAV5GI90_9BASI|nr:hypothetical protein Rhopal_001762-T1 [Rhodotorula paludigena]